MAGVHAVASFEQPDCCADAILHGDVEVFVQACGDEVLGGFRDGPDQCAERFQCFFAGDDVEPDRRAEGRFEGGE